MSRPDEEGAAVLVALVLVAFLALVALVAGGVVALVGVHRRAQGAADLAALAGAVALQSGSDACDAVAANAARNGASVEACQVDGAEVAVVVAVEAPALLSDLAGGDALRARARAGPALPFTAYRGAALRGSRAHG